jgi:hypothetical protein
MSLEILDIIEIVYTGSSGENKRRIVMGYSDDESMVRVDFFRKSGKWYTTEAVKWTGGWDNVSIHDAFKKSLRDHLGDRLSDMNAVCLHPYHRYAHPLWLRNGWE